MYGLSFKEQHIENMWYTDVDLLLGTFDYKGTNSVWKLKKSIDLSAKDIDGSTAFMLACKYGYNDVVKNILWAFFEWFSTTIPLLPHCLKITHNVAFEFWHFPPIFVLLKLTCLVTLFDRKLQVFKNSPNWPFFGISNELLSIQNINLARFARNVE